MSGDIFDRLLTSVPVNRQAGLALARGEHWAPKSRPGAPRWDAPPQMKAIPPGLQDQTGKVVGRLRCIGLLDAPRTQNGVSWVMRCTCGDYEVRKAKAINNPENINDMCHSCRRLQELKKRGSEQRWRR